MMLDIGCGYGYLLAGARKIVPGLSIGGVDGPWVDHRYLKFDPQYFYTRNLECDKLSLSIVPDFVSCLEVAEHLSPDSAMSLCEQLTSFRAPILFSAAIPGQGGQGHQNEQFTSFWADLFSKFDYLPADFLHSSIWVDDSLPFWFRQNPVVFYPISSLGGWRSTHVVKDNRLLDRAHPELLRMINAK